MNQLVKKMKLLTKLLCIGVFVWLLFEPAEAAASSLDGEGTVQIADDGDSGDYDDGYGYEEEEEPEQEIKIKKISFKKTKLKGKTGEILQLDPIVKPADATNQDMSYKSSNKKLATVNSEGEVTLKKKGTVTITCKAKDGSKKKAKVKITIKQGKTSSPIKVRKTTPSFKSKYYFSSGNIYYNYDRYAPTRKSFDGNKYCIGNCTWYACGRAWEILAGAKKEADLSIFGGNPYGIWQKNLQKDVYPTGQTPKAGALVVFGPKYGSYHIAVVEKIDGDNVYVSESGYRTMLSKPVKSDLIFHYGNINEWNRNREIIGYIYLLD